jgi:hypothetical protein
VRYVVLHLACAILLTSTTSLRARSGETTVSVTCRSVAEKPATDLRRQMMWVELVKLTEYVKRRWVLDRLNRRSPPDRFQRAYDSRGN